MTNLEKITIFTAFVFLTVFTGNAGAQEQPAPDEQADVPVYFLNFQPIPGLNVFRPGLKKTTDIFLIGTVLGYGYNLKGFGNAPVGLINSNRVQGVQLSGIFNMAKADMDGFQTASVYNTANGTVRGAQLAGVYNYASGTFTGLQIAGLVNRIKGDMSGIQLAPFNFRGEGDGVGIQVGLFNSSESGKVIPIGLVNKVKDGMRHFWFFTDDMLFVNAGYRSGSKIFYSHSNIGIGGELTGREGGQLLINRGGFGLEFPLRKFFIDIDISTGKIVRVDEVKDFWKFFFGSNTGIYQLRVMGGYKMYERLGVFAGASYDYLVRREDSDPSPKDFVGEGLGRTDAKSSHKVGLFGGLQF